MLPAASVQTELLWKLRYNLVEGNPLVRMRTLFYQRFNSWTFSFISLVLATGLHLKRRVTSLGLAWPAGQQICSWKHDPHWYNHLMGWLLLQQFGLHWLPHLGKAKVKAISIMHRFRFWVTVRIWSAKTILVSNVEGNVGALSKLFPVYDNSDKDRKWAEGRRAVLSKCWQVSTPFLPGEPASANARRISSPRPRTGK